MKNKTMKRIGTIILTVAMIMSFGASAFASTGEQGAFTVPDSPVSQAKILELQKEIKAYNFDEKEIGAPTISFSYTVAPAEVKEGTVVTDAASMHESGSSVTVPVKKGLGNPSVISNVAWNAEEDKLAAAKDGASNYKNIKIDFSSVVFEGAGIYRYIISEALTEGTYKDSAVTEGNGLHTRYIDVYVRPAVEGFDKGETAVEWDIYGYTCFYNNASITEDDKNIVAVKTTGFVSGNDGENAISADSYYTFNVTLSKTVVNDGYGAANTEFPFTVLFTNDAVTKNVNIEGKIENAAVTGWVDPAAGILSETNGVVNIKNGGQIKYIGIPNGTAVEAYETNIATGVTYQVTTEMTTSEVTTIEDASVSWGEAPKAAIAQAGQMVEMEWVKANAYESTKATFSTEANKADDNDYSIAITNTLITISPTGVTLRVAPYIVMLAAGMFLVIFSRRRKAACED